MKILAIAASIIISVILMGKVYASPSSPCEINPSLPGCNVTPYCEYPEFFDYKICTIVYCTPDVKCPHPCCCLYNCPKPIVCKNNFSHPLCQKPIPVPDCRHNPFHPDCPIPIDCKNNPFHPLCQKPDCLINPLHPLCQKPIDCENYPFHPDCRKDY